MSSRKSLAIALSITLLIFIVEVIGSFSANSLALLSDAGQMLTDSMALTLSLLAAIFASRPATKEKSFGFYRLEILAALINGSFLFMLALYIFFQAYQRLLNPVPVQSGILLTFAAIGFLANIVAALTLVGSSRENLNAKGAYLHVLYDLGSSFCVILGGILMYYTHWYYIDPILGFLIGLLILQGAVRLFSDSANVLLESVPEGINVDEVSQVIKSVKGVEKIQDLHIWSITSGRNAISAHLIISDADDNRAPEILHEINKMLKSKYKITHSTFQTECESCLIHG